MKLAVLLLALSFPAAASADVMWIELTQGDLSDDRFSPTPLPLAPGDNLLFGIIDGDDGQGNIDRDYFRITVPAGFQLAQISLDGYVSDDFAAFMGIQPGPIFPNDPDIVMPEDLYGWTLFGPSQIGQDLLPQLGVNGQGFTPPLAAGDYTFWVQQLDYYTEWYANFVVIVPEPGSGAAIGMVALIGASRRRRQRRL